MLEVRDVALRFDDQAVLRNVDLTVHQGEIVCLLGASGSGKTSLLRIIAGLETGYTGSVRVDEQVIDSVPVHQRGFGLMFQDFALFPHMTAAENVAFGLRMQQEDRKVRDKRVDEMLSLVGLADYADRDVTQLSGGEQQRVALARSLAPEPRLLMLDEPLGSLDAALRERLVVDVRRIIKDVGLTAVYVTHDQQEAYAIADRIAVIKAGQIEQIDAPQIIYQQPQTEFVARFLGLDNIVPVQGWQNGMAETAIGSFPVEADTAPQSLLIHPDAIHIVTGQNSFDEAVYTGQITETIFRGSHYEITMQLGENLSITFDAPTGQIVHHQTDDALSIRIDTASLVPLRA